MKPNSCACYGSNDIHECYCNKQNNMKNKETLEEVAANLFWTVGNEGIANIDSFIKGAKWQEERSYSEAIDLFITEIKNEFIHENWDYLEFIKVRVIEQFKQ